MFLWVEILELENHGKSSSGTCMANKTLGHTTRWYGRFMDSLLVATHNTFFLVTLLTFVECHDIAMSPMELFQSTNILLIGLKHIQ